MAKTVALKRGQFHSAGPSSLRSWCPRVRTRSSERCSEAGSSEASSSREAPYLRLIRSIWAPRVSRRNQSLRSTNQTSSCKMCVRWDPCSGREARRHVTIGHVWTQSTRRFNLVSRTKRSSLVWDLTKYRKCPPSPTFLRCS